MSEPRLATSLEVSALLARATAQGGFGAVLRRGDAERGALLILILERGTVRAVLSRVLRNDGRYGWERRNLADSDMAEQHLARARASDPDMWVLELDVPSAERFVVEMTSSG
jgi:hypothetical protein